MFDMFTPGSILSFVCMHSVSPRGHTLIFHPTLLNCALDAYPDVKNHFLVVTDASDYGIGASLEQSDHDGRRRPVAFFSHKLSDAERKYPVHERDLLAIVLALRKWRHLLFGSEFSVVCKTDHRPLQHFLTQSNLSPRQVRWQRYLSDNTFQSSMCLVQ